MLKIFIASFCRGQDQHIRYEHIYLPEPSSQPEIEYTEIKRPRLEIAPESIMRPSSHRPQLPLGSAEDIAKVSIFYRILYVRLIVSQYYSLTQPEYIVDSGTLYVLLCLFVFF